MVGRTITVDKIPFTVIGVGPPRFFGLNADAQPPDLWLPLTMQRELMESSSLLDAPGLYWLHLMGRQNAGVNMEQAQQWFTAHVVRYMRDLEGPRLSPARMQQIQGIKLMPGARGGSDLRGQYKQPLQVLMGVVVLVLLIACANLANFLLARTISRAREISTRLALGWTRARIVGQILIETLLLSFSGGVLGLLLAFWGTRALINFVVGGALIHLQSQTRRPRFGLHLRDLFADRVALRDCARRACLTHNRGCRPQGERPHGCGWGWSFGPCHRKDACGRSSHAISDPPGGRGPVSADLAQLREGKSGIRKQ